MTGEPSSAYGASNSFPKQASNTEEWLKAIGLSRYQEALAGLSLSDIAKLTDSERRERVPMDGQRKRLVLALQALDPSMEDRPQTPLVKYNSTSSLFINSTITKPLVEEMIFCVSVVLHDRINEGEEAAAEAVAKGERLPRFKVDSKALGCSLQVDLSQVVADSSGSGKPSEGAIFLVIKSIYAIAEFSPECLVIALLFMERLRTLTHIPLLVANWQPVLLAALLVAQKVWDDQSLLNIDFSVICDAYTLQDINQLEKQFLELLEFNVSISASLYASYYFELRTLCEKAERDFTFKPLSEEQQRKLEVNSDHAGKELKNNNKGWKSLTTCVPFSKA